MARLGRGAKNFLSLRLTTNQVSKAERYIEYYLIIFLAVHYLIYQLKDKAFGPKNSVINYDYIIYKAYVSAGIMKGNKEFSYFAKSIMQDKFCTFLPISKDSDTGK